MRLTSVGTFWRHATAPLPLEQPVAASNRVKGFPGRLYVLGGGAFFLYNQTGGYKRSYVHAFETAYIGPVAELAMTARNKGWLGGNKICVCTLPAPADWAIDVSEVKGFHESTFILVPR